MYKSILAALAIAIAGVTAASAMPASLPGQATVSVESDVIQVQHRHHHHRRDIHRPRHHHHGFVPGRRYRSAPPGWHRHHARPRDWRTRGCIMAGPIWFCP
ncbi:hypothetical protein [Bradyrhizobium sp. LHD-71]|uniref:hypothetical protein n=1 Tax=Bradyrhizobium sp. LHD-71 TaxID=3072141 RepID=UPI00280E3F4A|nr:hypothetical protein [Bradyrhizobium sp. LHD-71]MDQ8730886.1 hypothetical protein [Bradyrhizobium sp. LHD-71]